MSKVFVVDEEIKSEKFLFDTHKSAMSTDGPGQCEAKCVRIDSNSANLNGLIAATHLSFSAHVPLQLSPDIIWITVMQSLAICIKQEPDDFKDFFPKETVEIVVRNDNLTMNAESTDEWSDVIDKFTMQLDNKIDNELLALSQIDFSTSTPMTKTVANISLMGIVDPYVSFTAFSMCGIPSIYLDGEYNDWEALWLRCKQLKVMFPKLHWWLNKLQDLLAHFLDYTTHKTYWQSFYKHESGSGGDTVDGHINKLFPYVTNSSGQYVRNEFESTNFNSFPTLISSTRITWNKMGNTTPLNVVGGISDVCQDTTTYAVRPVCGWYIESTGEIIKVQRSKPQIGRFYEEDLGYGAFRSDYSNVGKEKVFTPAWNYGDFKYEEKDVPKFEFK